MADCSLINLGSCLPQKFFEFILSILNAPIKPFLDLTLKLLSEPIDISLFFSLWVLMVYVVSMFYALILIGTGINFIISGNDSARRDNAKNWLRNVVIMIVLIQASFFIYYLAIDLSSIMTSASLSLIDPNFFLITPDGLEDLAMALLFSLFYMVVLLVTALVLTIRYAFVSVGVVLFPIGILMYFFPFLKSYGSLILNFLGVSIFVTFFDAILLIGFSKLVDVGIFGEFKVIILISAFLVVSALMLILMFFSIIKAGFNVYTGIKRVGGKL